MTALFDHLPERLFSPLAGVNKRIYGALLLELYPLFFDQVHGDVFPSRETVRHEIEDRLAAQAPVWRQEMDVDTDDSGAGVRPEAAPAAAYRRLLAAGWLEEEVDGYKTRVTVPPTVGILWTALMEVARPDRVFYGGIVLSIHNNLQRAREEPREQVLALRQASREARRSLTHLNTMIYGLEGLLGEITTSADHRLVLSRFFDAFVERILVQDYKRLKTRNNPFRFRRQILYRVRELEYDPERRAALVDGFLEQTGASDRDQALAAIDDDIRRLRTVFEQLDGHLDRVDRYRERLECRVADTVCYLDHGRPGQAARIAELLKALAPRLVGLGDDADSPLPLPVMELLPLASHGLKEPSRRRRPPEPKTLRSRSVDPEARDRQRALRAYLDRRRIDPHRIVGYLERELGPRQRVDGCELRIEGIKDFIAFTHCRHLDYLPGGAALFAFNTAQVTSTTPGYAARPSPCTVAGRNRSRLMLRDLRQVCERAESSEPDDFRNAARALLTCQFLLLERSRDRAPYRLVANHFDYFTDLFDAPGWTLHRDDRLGIIGLLPLETEAHVQLRLVDSLLLLCLRLLYEEGLESFEARDGSVFVPSEVLLGRYETLLGRPRPRQTEYLEILARLRRHTLIGTGDEDESGLPVLRILPTIRLVTDNRVRERIRAFIEAAEANADDAVGDGEDDGEGPGDDEDVAGVSR